MLASQAETGDGGVGVGRKTNLRVSSCARSSVLWTASDYS